MNKKILLMTVAITMAAINLQTQRIRTIDKDGQPLAPAVQQKLNELWKADKD
jgi:hypothetical protein